MKINRIIYRLAANNSDNDYYKLAKAILAAFTTISSWDDGFKNLKNDSEKNRTEFKKIQSESGDLKSRYEKLLSNTTEINIDDLRDITNDWMELLRRLQRIVDVIGNDSSKSLSIANNQIKTIFNLQQKLNEKTELFDILMTNKFLLPKYIIRAYNCNAPNQSYYIFLIPPNLNKTEPVIMYLTKGKKRITSKCITNNKENLADQIRDTVDEFEKEAVTAINEDANAAGTIYTRVSNTENINQIEEVLDISDLKFISALKPTEEWKKYEKTHKKKETKSQNTEKVTIEIKVNFSHINILNELIRECQKEKIDYVFTRESSKKRLMTKYAIKNNELVEQLNKTCNINLQLVATYYSKKLDTDNGIDENYCAGVIVISGNIFLTIPSRAYSDFFNIINEYTRTKEELKQRSFFKKIKDHITNSGENTLNAMLSNNFSVRDIAANPFVNRDQAIYKYILKNVSGVKQFGSFTDANEYFKKYTSAQHIKLENNYSYLKSSATNVKEHVLKLAITFTSSNKISNKIDAMLTNDKYGPYILNKDEIKQQLNKLPRGIK